MKFIEWRDANEFGDCSAKAAWDYQQERIDELEAFVRDVANCNYDYPELKAQDLLARESE